MYLELNLVKIESIYSIYGSSLARHRVSVQNDTEAMAEIIKFIGENISIFDAALTDKSLVSKLDNLKLMSIDEFQCLRYALAERGLDIKYWAVSDVESNESEVPENSMEYNVVDSSNYLSGFVPFCTKLTVNVNEGSVAGIYKKIADMYGLFQGDLFQGRRNTFMNDIEVMQMQETAAGFVPSDLAAHTNSILEFCKKSIYIIGN